MLQLGDFKSLLVYFMKESGLLPLFVQQLCPHALYVLPRFHIDLVWDHSELGRPSRTHWRFKRLEL